MVAVVALPRCSLLVRASRGSSYPILGGFRMSFPLFFTLFRGLSPCLALRSNLLYLDLPVLVVCLNCVRVLYVWLKLG